MMLFCMLCVLGPMGAGTFILFKKEEILKPNGGGGIGDGDGARFRFLDIYFLVGQVIYSLEFRIGYTYSKLKLSIQIRLNMSDEMMKSEKVSDFRKRKGKLYKNKYGRMTSNTFRHCSQQQRGTGRIFSIGPRQVTKKITPQQISDFLKDCSTELMITEVYPTRFCGNERCEAPSRFFVDFERRGHSTCSKCGTVQNLKQSKMGTLHLGDDEKANKSMWNVTPGMSARDCSLMKRGKRLQIGSQRIKSHQRHYWAARKKIEFIADKFNFMAAELIIKNAQHKCKTFYYSIHNENSLDDDNHYKMPHGKAQFAAACLYAAVLEFEKSRGFKTPATLPVIIESAQWEVDRKNDRKTRDVTAEVIIKYLGLLKKRNLFQATIPEITAKTLRFKSKDAELEHARLAIFNKCNPTTITLSSKESWGIKVGDTNQGVLYIESVRGDSAAFQAGLRKGDYLFQFENKTINIISTPRDFEKMVLTAKKSEKEFIKVGIMREEK